MKIKQKRILSMIMLWVFTVLFIVAGVFSEICHMKKLHDLHSVLFLVQIFLMFAVWICAAIHFHFRKKDQ